MSLTLVDTVVRPMVDLTAPSHTLDLTGDLSRDLTSQARHDHCRRTANELLAMAVPRAEDELIDLAVAGDHRAFAELVQTHDDRMRGLAWNMLGDQTAMDDALQDAYLKAYRSLAKFRRDAAFSTWLYRITYTTCIDHQRKRGRRAEIALDVLVEQRDTGIDLDEHYAIHDELKEALSTLAPDQLAAVMLVDGEGLSYDEASDVLGVPPGTIASRLNRARSHLRRQLGAPPKDMS